METPISGTVAGSASELLHGYLSEEEYAKQRGVTLRTCQRDRALRQSPPYVIMGRQVYYRLEAIREWLVKREQSNDKTPKSFAKRGLR
jgi:hypothetical protein